MVGALPVFIPYVSHEKLVEYNKNTYYLALIKSQKTFGEKSENIFPWLGFFLDILLKQPEMAIKLLESEDVEKLFSPKQLEAWNPVSTCPQLRQVP